MKPTPILTGPAADRFLKILKNTPKASKQEVNKIKKFTKAILKSAKI